MRSRRPQGLVFLAPFLIGPPLLAADPKPAMPRPADGWRIELVAEAPKIKYPTAVVVSPVGDVYLGQDPMDMPGPPTVPADSVVVFKGGQGEPTVFADKLWAVMGLEWADDTLFVVHPPYLSAFRDTNRDGKADARLDLVTGLGPKLPGFSGINDHVASGLRLGMDGFLYIAVGDKGIPKGVGKDGATIQLYGGGVIRVRPDGTGLEVVSTGERNPLSVALTPRDDVFTYGNDDDSKQWPNSLTHHINGGHYGYPYDFLHHPTRALPVTAGEVGGSGTQSVYYDEGALPDDGKGHLFVCDWGLGTVFRYALHPKGATFRADPRTPFVTKGDLTDFRPFAIATSNDPKSLYLVDWAFNGWLADAAPTGRLYRLTYEGPGAIDPGPATVGNDLASLIKGLDSPRRSIRLASERALVRLGAAAVEPLKSRLARSRGTTGRVHSLWALDLINTPEARYAIRKALDDPSPEIRSQAARSSGIRRDALARPPLITLASDPDPTVRREVAIAMGRIGDEAFGVVLMARLGDPDPFVAWSVRKAIKALRAWDEPALTAALLDPKTQDDAVKLADESWAVPVVQALIKAYPSIRDETTRVRLVETLAGLDRKYPAWSGYWFGTNPLAGTFPKKTEAWDLSAMKKVQEGLTLALADPSAAVRLRAIAGLLTVGPEAAPALRQAITTETDPANVVALANGLGILGDFASAGPLAAIAQSADRPEAARAAALDALGQLKGPAAFNGRIMVAYDPKAPPTLVARALPSLARDKLVPANDLSGFLDNPAPEVRASALIALALSAKLPDYIVPAIVARLDDPAPEVRRAAIRAVAGLRRKEALPKLVALALNEADRSEATLALAAMPDPRALPVYLAAIRDKSPEARAAGESALLAIRGDVLPDLDKLALSGRVTGPAATGLDRVRARFRPLVDWKVIGPFARTTARVFVGDRSIDFGRTHSGAEGRSIAWKARAGDPKTGRVVLDDFKGGAGDKGGFGYDVNGSPDLCAFAYTEVESDAERPALLLIGSSGSVTVTLNEAIVHTYQNFAGRAYRPDSGVVAVTLKKGANRLLVQTRQGIGVWSIGVQVSDPLTGPVASAAKPATGGIEALRAFALAHDGDPKSGAALFFDPKGAGCAKCHSAGGEGKANAGPDLTGLALKYDRAEIIRSVLEPSNRIATGYQPVTISTHDGHVVTGLVRAENESFVELVDAEPKVVRVPKAEIDERRVGDVSVMPVGLADSLTVVEFADLISYLRSLKTAAPKPGP